MLETVLRSPNPRAVSHCSLHQRGARARTVNFRGPWSSGWGLL